MQLGCFWKSMFNYSLSIIVWMKASYSKNLLFFQNDLLTDLNIINKHVALSFKMEKPLNFTDNTFQSFKPNYSTM